VKFRCERDVLADVLGTAGKAVSARGGALPVLSCLRLALVGDTLRVTGSDLDLTITATAEVDGTADGEAVIPSKLAADIVRVLEPGAVELEVGDDEATITLGRAQFNVRTIPGTEYPRLQEPPQHGVTLPSHSLAEALRQVVAAASTDDSRPILTGVLITTEGDGLRLVATDSYRLAIRDLPGTSLLAEGQSVLVPRTALQELARVADKSAEVTVRLGDRDAAFDVGGVSLMTRLIEGEFPPYRSLIPAAQPNRLTIGREALLDAVRRVKVVAREPSTPVRLALRADGVDLSATAQDVGTAFEQLDAKYEGTEMSVAFNPDYLMAGIEAATGDEITLETVDALKPALLRSVDVAEFLYLLMPVRVA
jgi:DNA polymerase-3 subunit beta